MTGPSTGCQTYEMPLLRYGGTTTASVVLIRTISNAARRTVICRNSRDSLRTSRRGSRRMKISKTVRYGKRKIPVIDEFRLRGRVY